MSPSSEATSRSATQEYPNVFTETKLSLALPQVAAIILMLG
jgi:hypothetical protein